MGNTHSVEGLKGQGLAPIVQLLYFVIKNYEGGEFETFVLDAPMFKQSLETTKSHIVEESENVATLIIEKI